MAAAAIDFRLHGEKRSNDICDKLSEIHDVLLSD
jgi:hypothetical protein